MNATAPAPAPLDSDSRLAALQTLVDQGLTFSEVMQVMGETAEENPYVAKAQEQARDGELEVDERTIVSEGSDPGAYVLAWLWVEADDADDDNDDDDA